MKKSRVILLAVVLASGCSSPDYGKALCEAQRDRPDLCDPAAACGTAIVNASTADGPCADELAAMVAATPPTYMECFNACPVEETCTIGGATLNFRSCSCQADCVGSSPENYRTAVTAFADCLEAQSSVTSSCF